MRFRRPSVRARLTLWHAGVLTLIVCIFSAGILLFVEARLYAGLDAQLDREIATIGKIYREEPETGRTEGSGLPLGHYIVPGGRGRRHPSADRSMGARRTITRAAAKRLAIAAVLDGAERPSLSRP